jgi:3-(methylthio)propanoyl-CoA dehydrogenase
MANDFFNADMAAYVDHRVDWERYFRLKRGVSTDAADEVATYRSVLGTLGNVCAVIGDEAREHWHEEVRLEHGQVVVPPHIARGYERLKENGLVCLMLGAEFGGYGLPLLLNMFYLEMVSRADASLMTIVGLQAGVAGDIDKYGSPELKAQYLPRFASGELQGAMDLTEANAGSDLGRIATRVTEKDGRFFVDGEKIYITNGGAEIHLVLARDAATFEQSKGTTNGLSLVLCPRTLPDGRRNGVTVARTEKKLGIHGSPTCVMQFDNAEAFLLGTRGQGFRAMLDLMNNARLGVAAQAIGIAEAAFQEAFAYAQQRVQFDLPIVQQPLVKSMLTQMRMNILAARVLLYRTSVLIDMTEALRGYLASEAGTADPARATLQAELEHNLQIIRFFTPLTKYFATEISNHVTRQAIQVHGGIGYMAESAVGQLHSDSIITTIYEGTSEVQASFALKEMSKGALFTTLEDVRAELEPLLPRHERLVQLVYSGLGWINSCLGALMGDQQYALLNAKRLSEMVIDVVVSAELLLQADLDERRLNLARTFIHRHIAAVEVSARRVAVGDKTRLDRYDKILGL